MFHDFDAHWQEIVELVKVNCVQTYATANKYDPDDAVLEFISPARATEQLQLIERFIGKPIKGLNLLEVGSGSGSLEAIARLKFKVNAYGIDPGNDFYRQIITISKKMLDYYKIHESCIMVSVGEKMPFLDDKFDIVYSKNVLEHVRSPEQVIREAFRVLKPGGHLIFIIPNYGSWWEGHYGIFWFPHLPKWLAKIYVRLLGRDPKHLDHDLNLVSFRNLNPVIHSLGEKVEVLSWGQEVWEERMNGAELSTWSGLNLLKSVLRIMHKLRITAFVVWLGKLLHWETPMILHLKKSERD
jgi:SAM-dependent methyltransferase